MTFSLLDGCLVLYFIFPVIIFANYRGGDRHGHHDISRRHRHTSGMALPAISDSFDAFELLGLDRTEVGQVGAVIDSFVF